MSEKETGIVGIIAFIVVLIIAFVLCINMPTNSFENTEKYKTTRHCVYKGESAWDIYKETCPNTNWNEWCSYVSKINDKINLETIYPGDILLIPIPIEQ